MSSKSLAILTVTRRSRIGFSWTNTPERWTDHNGQSHLRISDPSDVPQVIGYVRKVVNEYSRVAQLNNSNDWSRRWFVWHDGAWVTVWLEIIDLWMLLDINRCAPRTDSIEARVIR